MRHIVSFVVTGRTKENNLKLGILVEELSLVSLGTGWRQISGNMMRIESGPNGAVWGVNKNGNIFTRAGVSRKNPIGQGWVRVGGRLNYVTVGCTGVYGVGLKYAVWRYNGK